MNPYEVYMAKTAGIGPHVESLTNLLKLYNARTPTVTIHEAIADLSGMAPHEGTIKGVIGEARGLVGHAKRHLRTPEPIATHNRIPPAALIGGLGIGGLAAGDYLGLNS